MAIKDTLTLVAWVLGTGDPGMLVLRGAPMDVGGKDTPPIDVGGKDTPPLVLEGGTSVDGRDGGRVSPPCAREINFIACTGNNVKD